MAHIGDIKVGDMVATIRDDTRYEIDVPDGTKGKVISMCSSGCCIEIQTSLVERTLNYDVSFVDKYKACMFGDET